MQQLLDARDYVVVMHRQSVSTAERRTIRTVLGHLDNEVARTRLEIDVRGLTDAAFATLLTLPQRRPVEPGNVFQSADDTQIREVSEALTTLGLVRPWSGGRLILSTRGSVFRTVTAMRVSRKTAEAERAIARSPYSRRYRSTLKQIIQSGKGEPEVIDVLPSVRLPFTYLESSASVPTMIVALTAPSAFRWERISVDERWSRIKVESEPSRFRAEAVDFFRSIYETKTPAEALEVVAITLQDAASSTGQELGRIVETVRGATPPL